MRNLWVGGLVALAVAAGGCSGDGGPPPPTQTDASQPTVATQVTTDMATSDTGTSTSAFVPVQPQDLPPVPVPEQTSESAVEFLQWWVAMLNRVELTGETELIRQHSLPECVFCNGRIENIDRIYSAGGRVELRGSSSVDQLSAGELDANAYVVVEFTGQTPESRVFDAAGAIVTSTPPTLSAPFVAGIQWNDGRWLLRGLGEA